MIKGKKTLIHRRGVSPVIATLLLILVAIAAGATIYTYMTGFLGTSTRTAEAGQKTTLSIDMVSVNSTSAPIQITVYIRNTGLFDAEDITTYFQYANGTTLMSAGTLDVSKGTKSTDTITDGSHSLTSGDVYTVKAVAKDGSSTTYTYKAP
ncbi:MAG: archaellin/type IV pilin N-terminal domain-containing protein [Candidatus Geothermarchaeales archaeon]